MIRKIKMDILIIPVSTIIWLEEKSKRVLPCCGFGKRTGFAMTAWERCPEAGIEKGDGRMSDKKIRFMVTAAVMAALTYVATTVVRIPAPTGGYVHMGDGLVLLCGWILGPWWGGAAAGIGSMLVDLLGGYMSFVPGTLVIKFLDAMAAALIVKALGRRTYSYVLGGIAGEAIMVAGYFVYEAAALKLGMGAAAGVLANVGQGAVGLVIALVLMALLKGSKALDKLAVQW